MKLRIMRASKVDELLKQIPYNLNLYRTGNFDFIRDDPSCYIEVDSDLDENELNKINCTPADHKEVENCINIFRAIKKISPYLARDDRLWVNLTHADLFEYTRQRWPIPDDNAQAIRHIKNHYFVVGQRGFERDNAASRLWWMATLCNRVKGLTLEQALICLLHQYDVRANIIERPTTSQSKQVFSAILKNLYKSYKGDKSLFERTKFRRAMRELNLIGGTKLLSAMEENEINLIIKNCML